MHFIVLGLLACSAGAPQQPEQLRPPLQIEGPLPDWIEFLPAEPRPEHGKQTVWQLYSIDPWGRFRPRVTPTPHGAYYLHSGAPFHWTTLGGTYHRPFVSP